MSNYYDSLGQDLAPKMGMPPIDPQTGEPIAPPPMPPPMSGGPPQSTMAQPPPLPPGPSQASGGPPQSTLGPPPPMSGGPPQSTLDPISQAQGQVGHIIGSTPGGGGPPMPPPMPGGGGGGPPGGPGMTNPAVGGNSVPFGPSTDYRTAMGIAPTPGDRNQSMMAGLGKGLSAAAGNSNKAGAVFGRGAGGAITGGINEEQEQQKLKAGLQNQYFNQTSTAFKDAMTQKSTDTKDLYWQARAQQYQALAKANGGKAQPWNADQLALSKAEDEARKNYASDRADLDQQKGQLPPDEYVKQMAALQAKKGQYFTDSYKKYGVDPNKVENLKTQGMSPEHPFSQVKNGDWYIGPDGKEKQKTAGDATYGPADTVKHINPFDTKGMDVNAFHQSVPMNGYYTVGKNLYKRTVPPPAGSGTPQSGQIGAPQDQLNKSVQQAEQEEMMTGGPQ